jgi:hypothetical protein
VEALYLVLNRPSTVLKTSLETTDEKQNARCVNCLPSDLLPFRKVNMAIDFESTTSLLF